MNGKETALLLHSSRTATKHAVDRVRGRGGDAMILQANAQYLQGRLIVGKRIGINAP